MSGSNSAVSGGYQTVVSYVSVPVVNNGNTTYSLIRQVCSSGASATPTSATTMSHDIGTPTVTVNGPLEVSPPAPANTYTDWTSNFSTWNSMTVSPTSR